MDTRSEHLNFDTDYFPIFVTGVNGSGKTTFIKNLHSNAIVTKETSSWEISQYYDQQKKIVYLDMPFFDGYDRNYKEVARREHIIRDLAYQVQESKGVFIFVLDYNSLYGSPQSVQGLFDALKVLNEEMSTSPTLFVMTKAEKPEEPVLSSEMADFAEFAEFVFRGQTQIARIKNKMSDPKNWVYADANMSEKTKQEIDTWLGEHRSLAKKVQCTHHAVAPSSTAAIYHSTANSQKHEAKKDLALNGHANAYSEETQKYLDQVKPNDIAILNHLLAHQLSDCRDSVTKKIAKIPVFLNGLLYDLQTLLDCKEHNGFRKIPLSTTDFCLHDIQPADAVHLKIQETIQIILQERAKEEKLKSQAATCTASAERARKQNRACAIL